MSAAALLSISTSGDSRVIRVQAKLGLRVALGSCALPTVPLSPEPAAIGSPVDPTVTARPAPAAPIGTILAARMPNSGPAMATVGIAIRRPSRSEEHTSELQ